MSKNRNVLIDSADYIGTYGPTEMVIEGVAVTQIRYQIRNKKTDVLEGHTMLLSELLQAVPQYQERLDKLRSGDGELSAVL